VARRFPIYTDADVYGPLVKCLVAAGWDVLRAIDAQPEGARDDVHFSAAARAGRVLVSNDLDQRLIAKRWIREGRAFPGLITWPQEYRYRSGVSAFLAAFEDLARQDEPFACPIVHLQPRD
jgi:hypothetical protein